MALLHIDGFEGYGKEDVDSFWESASFFGAGAYISQVGRRGGYCANAPSRVNSSNVGLYWSNPNPFDDQVIVVGCAFKMNFSSNTPMVIQIRSGSDSVAHIAVRSDSVIGVYYQPYGTAALLYESSAITWDTWYYLELKARKHTSEGFVQCRINEELVCDESGLDTVGYNSGGTQISGVKFEASIYTQWCLDDIYILDTTGSKNNDFLGDIRVDMINPNGAGNYTQLTPSAGSNYQCVDETNMDDSDYVEGANAGDKDSYTYANAPTDIDDAAIFGIQLNTQVIRTAEADNIKMKGFLRTGSTDYEETTAQSLSDIVTSKKVIWEDDPSDSNIWTQAKINACEFGMEVN
jgi:hypothetical protein